MRLSSSAATPAACAHSPAVPGRGAFYQPVTTAPHSAGSGSAGAAAAKGVLSHGLGWLQAAGQQAESAAASRGSASARLLGQSLSWISRELAPEPTPSMADELRPVFFPPPPPPAPPATPATPQTPGGGSSSGGAGGRAQTEQQTRDALLGGGRPAVARQPTPDDGPAGRAARGARRAAGAMGESLDAAVERGEKLNQLGDKSQQLADDAEDFASLAKQLRQNQEKGFFGQLFG